MFIWKETASITAYSLFLILLRYTSSTDGFFFDILWPIFHFQRNDDNWRFSIRPFVWIVNEASHYLFTLLGIILYRRKDGKSYFHILPFIFYRSGSFSSSFVLFPLIWVFRKHGRTKIFIAPFIFLSFDDDDVTFVLFPLIWFKSSNSGFRFFLFPFIWISKRSENYKFMLIPFFFWIKTTQGVIAFLFPFIWFSKTSSATRFMLLPIVFVTSKTNYFKFALIPFFWYSKSNSTKTLWVVPIWYRCRTDGTWSLFFIPVLVYKKFSGNDGFFLWTVPYWIRSHSTGFSHAFVYFIFYSRDGIRKRFFVVPLVWYFRYTSEHWKFVFFPLVWSGKSGNNNHFVFFPFVWRFRDGSESTFVFFPIFWKFTNITVIVPLMYKQTNGPGNYVLLLLLFYLKRHTEGVYSWTFFPLVWVNAKAGYYSFTFFPVFFYRNDVEENSKLIHFWPIYGIKTTRSQTTHMIVWPIAIFRYTETEKRYHIFPLFFFYKDDKIMKFVSIIVYRFVSAKGKVLLVLPLYYHVEEGAYTLRIITLLYFYVKTAENMFLSAFFLYLKKVTYRDGEVRTSSVYVFPLYGKETRGHHYVRHLLFYPLFSRRVDKETDLFALDVLWPLFHYSSAPNHKAVRFLLYLRKITPTATYRVILPLYYSFSQSVIKNNNNNNNPSTASPVTTIQAFDGNNNREDEIELRELEEMGEIRNEPISGDAIAIGEREEEKNKKIETELVNYITVFFPFFIRKATPEKGIIYGAIFFLLPPLFIRKWDNKKDSQSTHVWPFYSHSREGIQTRASVLLILFRYFADTEMGILNWHFLLFFYRRSREVTKYFFVPLFYRARKPDGSNTFVVIILWYYNKIMEGNELHIALFWLHPTYATLIYYFKNSIFRKFFFFPLFWRRYDPETLRCSICLFWLHHKVSLAKLTKQREQMKVFFFPLFHYRRDGERKALSFIFGGLPLLSLYRSVHEGDRLVSRWFWPIVYNHYDEGSSYRCLIWVHPYLAMCKSISNSAQRIVFMFPLFYFSKSSDSTFFVLIWFFHPLLSLYRRIKFTGLYSITWFFPLFYSRKSSTEKIFSLVWFFHPKAALFYKQREDNSGLSYFLFLYRFYYGINNFEFSFIWLFHPKACLVYKMKETETEGLSYFFLLYWHLYNSTSNAYGLIWLFHRKASLMLYKHDTRKNKTKTYFWPLFYTVKRDNERKWCLVYLYPPRVAFITSSGSGSVTIFLIYASRIVDGKKVRSIIYLFHPAASFFRITTGPNYVSVWMLIVFYFSYDSAQQESDFALFWFYAPAYAVITRSTYSGGDMTSHILFVFWKSVEDGYLSFGFIWLFHHQASLAAYKSSADSTKHYLIPLYWYTSNTEAWTFSFCLWFIFMKGTDTSRDFRVLYRFFRVATGHKTIVEWQPFFYYRRQGGDSEFIIVGGLCGREHRRGRDSCIACWMHES